MSVKREFIGAFVFFSFACNNILANNIQVCAASEQKSISNATVYECADDINYQVSSPTPADSQSVEWGDNVFTIVVNPPLTVTADNCPEALGDLTCSEVILSMPTFADGTDGSAIAIDGISPHGLVNWKCNDESGNEIHYYFPIAIDHVSGANFNAQFITAYTRSGPHSYDNIPPSDLNKFEKVGNDTDVYFFKTSSTISSFVFNSDETTIKLKWISEQIGSYSPNTSIQTTPTADVCNQAVQLKSRPKSIQPESGPNSNTENELLGLMPQVLTALAIAGRIY